MANLVKFHLQVTTLDTSSSSIDDSSAVLSSGITNTGNITNTGTDEATGGFITTNDSGNRVQITVEDIGGGNDALLLTRL